MSDEPKNKIVLITGATGGIGRATALALAKQGTYTLALHYNTATRETRDTLLSAIKAADTGIHAAFFQADMSSFDSVRALHTSVVTQLGDPTILFLNAGANGGHTGVPNLHSLPFETFESTWRINTASPILLTQVCLPFMEAQGWGRVIFCSSVAAFTGGFVGPHYASSKSALHGFVHWLANNVAGKGVTVNAVAPAMVGGTGMMGPQEGDEEVRRRVEARLPVGRLGKPEEVAETVLWMVKTGYVTNKVIAVDGGYYPY